MRGLLPVMEIKRKIAKFLLVIVGDIVTKMPITNFTSRLIDKLIVASER